jgi:hypothetical protein
MNLPPDIEADSPKICHLRRWRYLDILVGKGVSTKVMSIADGFPCFVAMGHRDE